MWYEYDIASKDVLIRSLDESGKIEILHKGDKQWTLLIPRSDYTDESYCRAIYLGQGCWEDLKRITSEEAAEIIKQWGYEEDPPQA